MKFLWINIAFFALTGIASGSCNEQKYKKYEDYLMQIETISSDFIQVSNGKKSGKGIFMLKRPNNMKIDYTQGQDVLIISKKNFLIYYDKELEETSHIPKSKTPVSFILEKKKFSDLNILSCEEKDLFNISFKRKDNDDEAIVTLSFDNEVPKLRSIKVKNQSETVEIVMENLLENGEINDKEFFFKDNRI
jgi:outer membrane lipoprotein-sorting protein